MSLIRYHVPHAFRAMPVDVRQLFDSFLTEDKENGTSVAANWQPRVDVREEPTRFVIAADIPGVDPKDIEIHMEAGLLTIKGERASESLQEGGRSIRLERSSGSFQRRFTLPDSADAETIRASGKNGVLEVVIPKRAQHSARRIEINTQ